MIRLTTEQAQQIEEALEDIVRVFEFETGTPVEALATIRAARAHELNLNCKSVQKRLATQWGYVKADQAEQAPVAWLLEGGSCVEFTYCDYHDGDEWTPLYAAPQPVTTPDVCGEVCVRAKLCYGCGKALDEANAKYIEQSEQEPVAWLIDWPDEPELGHYFAEQPNEIARSRPLYAAPVQQVDLTDDEIMDLVRDECVDMRWPSTPLFIARAVIAKFKEKNK